DSLADTITQEGDDFGLHAGELIEDLANLLHQLLLLLAGNVRFELDVEFATVRAEGILPLLGAADLLLDAGDVFVLLQLLGDFSTDPQHLGNRGAGHGLDLKHEVSFAEWREEFTAQARELQENGQADKRHREYDRTRPASNQSQQPAVDAFQP